MHTESKHTESKDEMRERILEAALKRFTHYSASKTTMNEIAEDLHCSKASLYYYFPDKKGLHIAVLEKIGELYFSELEAEIEDVKQASKTLFRLIDVRHDFVRRFCRLELFKVLNDPSFHNEEIMKKVKERELKLLVTVFEVGVKTGEFNISKNNIRQMAELYSLAMIGLRFSVLEGKDQINIDEEDFSAVSKQQKLLTEVFVNGLKY
ncbi:TetR/AcrR family transcriptional regulator [Chitinophaga pendula]|uniref:TetR/AcrR family transcriptional regulator n=1 Tax=Chitinophaga TaxID=79328 RepID=UPI000BAF05D9|nr:MULTISPECIES: TetR/AcrR family transcriptional regulator [Chitinophaga]ASZ10244.1 hypothetical protein CK934_04240 [Chitinophaga sp. MD30]UCJ06796.1 TetR/AcrR family transcriptional regulator [Chitinophaga pendula]